MCFYACLFCLFVVVFVFLYVCAFVFILDFYNTIYRFGTKTNKKVNQINGNTCILKALTAITWIPVDIPRFVKFCYL